MTGASRKPKPEAQTIGRPFEADAPRGASNVWRPLGADRRQAFIRNKSKLNTKSPLPLDGGADQSLQLRLLTDLRPSHSGIFFPRPRISGCISGHLGNAGDAQQKKQSHFKGRFEHTAASSRRLMEYFPIYFQPPGGGQKSGRFRSGTGGPATQTFSEVSEKFFLKPERCVAGL